MVDPKTSVINVLILKRDVWSSRDLLIWLNAQLECEVAQIKDLRTGAIYCQLLHRLYPSNIRLDCVKLYTRKQNEFVLNFTLLSKSFKELRINYEVPQKQLINGIGHHFFLNWYHKFYETNVNENIKYDPRKERKFSKIGMKPCRLTNIPTVGTLKIAYNFEKFLNCAKINIESKAHEAAEFPKREFLFVKRFTLFTNTGDQQDEIAGKSEKEIVKGLDEKDDIETHKNNTEDESQGTNDDNRNEDEMKKVNKPLKGDEIMPMLTKENIQYHKILSRVFDFIADKDADSEDLISDLREYFESMDKS
ncbi:uncharacterized protein LOC133848808 [Drosophila sulfurigaster albostrigata]|uniref:uncharacterized protein LOC133848808 n=1 Tax=Drosophila sulfurigaster albostrigata TaxID=89887 RepID=UPI002D21DA16|nr:uncharacterized protein LOC133848808 [Drosophila sulfurigaster albostrigata]